jgi:hypothetical protein
MTLPLDMTSLLMTSDVDVTSSLGTTSVVEIASVVEDLLPFLERSQVFGLGETLPRLPA